MRADNFTFNEQLDPNGEPYNGADAFHFCKAEIVRMFGLAARLNQAYRFPTEDDLLRAEIREFGLGIEYALESYKVYLKDSRQYWFTVIYYARKRWQDSKIHTYKSYPGTVEALAMRDMKAGYNPKIEPVRPKSHTDLLVHNTLEFMEKGGEQW